MVNLGQAQNLKDFASRLPNLCWFEYVVLMRQIVNLGQAQLRRFSDRSKSRTGTAEKVQQLRHQIQTLL